jgi:hypothetical protein
MLENRWLALGLDSLLIIFTIYLFFEYFNLFFICKKKRSYIAIGVTVFVIWQVEILNFISFSVATIYNIGVTIGITLFIVTIMFEGKFWKKCFFCIVFDAIWMLSEMLIHNLLLLYSAALAHSQLFGSFVSKVLLMTVILALKKVFKSEKVIELSDKNSFLLVLIPVGSIYIMSVVFMLAYNISDKLAKIYSFIAVFVLLFINVLIFYVYIEFADILYVKKMNLLYERQLELCERHQEETEVSMLRVREVKHNMKNHFISIIGYVEKREYAELKKFINEIIDEGNLSLSTIVNSGHVVVDSLVEYWNRVAESQEIEFETNVCIPMEMPFKRADISLVLGNLLENAVEGASKAEGKKYIRLKMKYDKDNLLIALENNYKGKLKKLNEKRILTTKEDDVNHGIGLVSVDRAMRKYKGMMFIDDSVPKRFLIRVVLYGNKYE